MLERLGRRTRAPRVGARNRKLGINSVKDIKHRKIAYTITRTVIDNKDALVRGHAGLAEFDPRTAWEPGKVGLPRHPGAERAYREKGYMK